MENKYSGLTVLGIMISGAGCCIWIRRWPELTEFNRNSGSDRISEIFLSSPDYQNRFRNGHDDNYVFVNPVFRLFLLYLENGR